MTAFKLKGYCSFVKETLKKFNWKGVRSVSSQAIQVKHTFDKKRKVLFGVPNTIIRSSYSSKKNFEFLPFLEKELGCPRDKLCLQLSKMTVRKNRKLSQVKEVLNFLRQNGYKNVVIAESVQICFYSIKQIKDGFQQIAENEEKLSRIGLHKGFVRKNKQMFTESTSSRNKKLQLCLYYMELPYEFTGHGTYM